MVEVTYKKAKRKGRMKSFRKELWFNIPTRRAFVNITPQVEECLKESGVKEGLALTKTKHTKSKLRSHSF